MGSLSLIIWSLTLMVTVKYVTIVLYADDEGEGGTFALYSLLTRYVSYTYIVAVTFSEYGMVSDMNVSEGGGSL